MASFKAILKGRACLCKGTTAFYFERSQGFEFRAGRLAASLVRVSRSTRWECPTTRNSPVIETSTRFTLPCQICT
jgi:hypothetical protein